MADKAWTDEMYHKCYQFAQVGMGDMKIAKAVGVTYKTFKRWLVKKPALKVCLKEARLRMKSEGTFRDYVYGQLDLKTQELWDQLNDPDNNSVEDIESILMGKGDKVRQRLFLHALCDLDFNPSEAMSKVNISKKTVKKWLVTDPEFVELLDEVEEIKNNFGEGCLFRLMKEGNAAAILFYNERKNDARGYGKKMKVQHEGEIGHSHTHSVAELDLDLATEKALLDAVRRQQRAAIDYKPGDIVDAEFQEIE